MTPEEGHYPVGQPIEVSLSLTNVSSDPITIDQYPPDIRVAPKSDWDQTILSVPGGTGRKILQPGETVSLDFTWDQKDSVGNQVAPGC